VDELWSVDEPDEPLSDDLESRPTLDPSSSEAGSLRPVEQGATGGLIRARLGGRFERPQLIVVSVIVIIGLLLSGWAVLRARPVAIASPTPPTTGSSQEPTGASMPGETSPTAHDPPAGPDSPAALITVHVLGAVHSPGVVELPAGSRVQDALHAADGAKERADLGDLNLAQPLTDGQQVFIARDGGVSEVRDPGGGGAAAPGRAAGPGSSSGSEGATSVVNLNTATSQELDQLPGVGPVTAQKILTWRDRNGSFSSVEELQEIDGIGPKTFAELAPLVTV
jgi:competence protein ComEA